MSSYNERLEWEYQDYLKQRYEEQQAAGYDGVRKIVCGGCGRVFYTTIYTKKYCHSYWCGNQANNRRQREYRQIHRQGFGLSVLRREIHAQTCRCPLLQQCLSVKRLSKTCYRCCKCSK